MSELAELAREMGIDPSQLMAGGGSPSVYLGGQTGPMPVERGPFPGPDRDPDRAFQPAPILGSGPLADGDKAFRAVESPRGEHVGNVEQLLSELFTMNESRLQSLQRDLLDGGFYRVAPENVGWGTPDEATVDAYNTALNRAATYYAAGVKKTPREVIKDAAKARLEAEEEFKQGVVGGGNVYTINLSDPASLRKVADSISSRVLGKKADPEIEAKIANAIRSAQASEQGKVNQAMEAAKRRRHGQNLAAQGGESGYAPPTTVTQQAVDPEARAEEMLRSEFPLEAAGMEAADGYRSFLGLLAPGGIR